MLYVCSDEAHDKSNTFKALSFGGPTGASQHYINIFSVIYNIVVFYCTEVIIDDTI